MWDFVFSVLNAHVTWRHVERPICALKDDRQSSLKAGVCDAFLFVGGLFEK